ncbi:MAG: VTT domain-containing protein [Nanoarchaeota archaeon]|nr:VTT domain-containing protein [Nanoarchaeota archaeon]
MNNNKRNIIEITVIVVIYLILTLIIWKIIQGYLTTDFFSSILSKTGILAPVIMILIQALQVLIAPIPVQPVSIASGYIFGAFWGFIIAYTGLIIGSFIAFYIGKIFGRPLVKKIVSKKIMNKYDGYIQNVSVFILTLIMWLPLFPDDEILYILGMSKTKVKKITIPVFIGKTGGACTAIIGAGLEKYSPFSFHIIFLVLLMTIMGFYYKNKLEMWFEKLMKKCKKK